MQESTNPNTPPSPQAHDLAVLGKELQRFISQYPQVIGGADIYSIGPRKPELLAGSLSAVLACLVDENQTPVVKKILAVMPAGSDVEDSDARVLNAMTATFSLLAHREMKSDEQSWFRRCLQTVVAEDRQICSVLNIISVQSGCTAIIVIDSASYRDVSVDPYIAPGASTPLLLEDIWVPQLHALAVQAVKMAQVRQLYVALDTGRLGPTRKTLSDLLGSIDGCGFVSSTSEGSPEHVLSMKVDQWNAWIREGRLGQVLRDIDHLPTALDQSKPYLRIQMLHKAGHVPQALQAIREYITSGARLEQPIRVKLARIAQDANASALATQILSPAVEELNSCEDLESALATAHDAGSAELEEKLAARLEAMFPASHALREHRRRALRAKRGYARIAAMYAEEEGGHTKAEFYGRLASFLSVPHVPHYHGLIASAGGDISQTDAYRMACVNDALVRKLLIHAFELALPLPTTPVQTGTGELLLLKTLQEILLHVQKGGELPVSLEQIQEAVLSLIKQLAADPSNQALRIGLADLLQPSVAGMTGLALMAKLVHDLVSRPIRLVKRRLQRTTDARWFAAHESFLNSAFSWLQSEGLVIIGKSVLPKSLLTEPADQIVSAVADYLGRVPIDSGEEANDVQMWLAVGTSVTPHCSDPDFDLVLLRLMAARLADFGHPQLARDLAEQALLISTSTPRRSRLGWFAMADVYQRCKNPLEGLLAMACTLAADDEVEEEQAYLESVAIARMLRDCGLKSQARQAITRTRQLLQQTGLLDMYSHRLDTLELQMRQSNLDPDSSRNAELEVLLMDVARNGAAVLAQGDMPEPVAVLLGQLLRQAKAAGATIPPKAEEVFTELRSRAIGGSGSLVDAMSSNALSANQLLALLKTSVPTRYSGDVGYDMRNVATAARRAVASDTYISNAIHTSFALELLADRGVAVPGWDEAAEPPPGPQRVEEPAEIACSLSKEGLSVVQVGFDAAGRLVRISAVDGAIGDPVRESDINAQELFRKWATRYPFDYGIDETTVNLFYTTTADLRLPVLPEAGPVVVVADVAFQPFPPNLLYVRDEFAGRVRPMAAAPSLLWLKSARDKGTTGDGRLCAWVSMAAGRTLTQTLPMIAQRLASTFDEYGFKVDPSPTLPATFAGASLAVIVAHGGVHPDGRFFQVIADEGKLRVTAGDLANALRNIDIVILFVCSGGRVDEHPQAITTLGLAKQILDRGCSAVIASPWPLDPRVPSYWLPEFLNRLSQGENLIEANFAANQIVDQAFAHDPARGLAMTLLGNPGARGPKGLTPELT
jgi:hypothetical protein